MVTIGTAGKVFSSAPGDWKPFTKTRTISTSDRGVFKTQNSIASLIDHTLLRADATEKEIEQLCMEARQFGFFSVCVNPTHVSFARKCTRSSHLKVCAVAGFPLGTSTPLVKSLEAQGALAQGADEIDAVINVGSLKSGCVEFVYKEICSLREITQGRILKIIIETAYLTDEEKVKASVLAKKAGADFVKTSTGFAHSGASVVDIELIRRAVGPEMGIKASGGIKNLDFAKKLIAAGATRIGTSASVAIVSEVRE